MTSWGSESKCLLHRVLSSVPAFSSGLHLLILDIPGASGTQIKMLQLSPHHMAVGGSWGPACPLTCVFLVGTWCYNSKIQACVTQPE